MVQIAHRGASGFVPEHTLAAYELAIRLGVDYIEPDVVSTRDGILVARHENELSGTTDIADRPEFADRRTSKLIDGAVVTGWFTEDLTLAELKTLRARERLPSTRPENAKLDGLYEVPTLTEVVDLARRSRTATGRRMGVYPETKHPTYFRSIGLPLEDELVRALQEHGYGDAEAPVFLQSLEPSSLTRMAEQTDSPLVQLIEGRGAPYDWVSSGDRRTFADLLTVDGLREVSRYATGIGAFKNLLIPRDESEHLLQPASVIDDAHSAGLTVHGWTFRRENVFLPVQFRRGEDPLAVGDLAGEVEAFLAAGVDGIFTDNPTAPQLSAVAS